MMRSLCLVLRLPSCWPTLPYDFEVRILSIKITVLEERTTAGALLGIELQASSDDVCEASTQAGRHRRTAIRRADGVNCTDFIVE